MVAHNTGRCWISSDSFTSVCLVNGLFCGSVRDYSGARLAWVGACACARVERKDLKDPLDCPLRSVVKYLPDIIIVILISDLSHRIWRSSRKA